MIDRAIARLCIVTGLALMVIAVAAWMEPERAISARPPHPFTEVSR